ncbi:GNVR domain-containing protein [Bosea sp. PAMC 26642]|uniref:GNVR domain-containing protein n=1 Tax=Bosea sp. (strain PAMC 26642) TaxID=1792307 RepID=UPI00143A6110|nr:GNVR domain-containing protein [Bosea sp. PAMC 26642]
MDKAAAQLSKSVSVRTEPNSEVLKIVFRHRDPVVSAQFANALAQSFIERQIKLLDRPGAVDFFRVQTSRFDAEVERQSALFHTFVTKQMTYSVDDQRTLLLRRSSELAAALSATRGQLAEKQGQAAALTAQLRLLKPVTQSPFVSTLVDSLGGKALVGPVPRSPSRGGSIEGEPPLLMIKVYQDGIAALFKLNSDLAGIRDMQTQQEAEVAKINGELAALAASQTEFERLKRDVALATYNAEIYAKRTVEEQIESDLRSAKLSNVRVIQGSLVPLQAVFPNGPIFAALGLVFGTILGLAVTLLIESLSADSTAPLVERRSQSATPAPVANDQPAGARPVLHRPSLVASMAVARDRGPGQVSSRQA